MAVEDKADAGSVADDGQSAGAPAVPKAGADNGSAAQADNPFSGLQDEGARKWVETKGYKTVDDVVTAAHSLEQRMGTVVTPPAADAPKEEWDKFYERLPEERRPLADPGKIEFKRPQDYPEDLPYNEELAEASKPWMAEAGLTRSQAQAMHDKFAGYMAEQAKMQVAEIARQVEATHDDLVKDWGPLESEGFKQKLELADRAMKKLGLVDAYKAKGILLADGSLTDPQIARAFSVIGETMFRDDKIGAGDAVSGGNPFKTRDVDAMSAMAKTDPERAKRLAKEAGVDVNLYFPSNPQ